MMMGPLYQETDQRRPRRVLLSVLVLCMIVATAAFYTESFREVLLRMSEPVVLLRASVLGDTTVGTPSMPYRELQEENRRLEEALMHARIETGRTEALALENQLLRERLLHASIDEASVQATILRRPPETLYDTLVVVVGRESRVSIGDRVYSGSAFMGRVVSVGSALAQVVLASAPGEETSGFIVSGTSTHPLRMTGLGQGAFESSLPRSIPVAEGDPVLVYVGEWEVLAEVVSIQDAPTDAWVRIDLRSPVNVWHLRTVDIRSTPQ